MHQILIETGLRVRVDISPRWSARTIHTRYTFDPENLAKGQCGVSSFEKARRLSAIARNAMILDAVMRGERVLGTRANSRPGGETYDARDELCEFMENNPEHTQRVREWGHELVGMAFACDYGDMINNETGEVISDDHCWVRIVKLDQLADFKKRMIGDITPDQFSTPSQELPPIIVQPAKAEDRRFGYRIRESTPLGTLDTYNPSQLGFKRRHGMLVGGGTPFREWLLQADTNSHYKFQYEQLKARLKRFDTL